MKIIILLASRPDFYRILGYLYAVIHHLIHRL